MLNLVNPFNKPFQFMIDSHPKKYVVFLSWVDQLLSCSSQRNCVYTTFEGKYYYDSLKSVPLNRNIKRIFLTSSIALYYLIPELRLAITALFLGLIALKMAFRSVIEKNTKQYEFKKFIEFRNLDERQCVIQYFESHGFVMPQSVSDLKGPTGNEIVGGLFNNLLVSMMPPSWLTGPS